MTPRFRKKLMKWQEQHGDRLLTVLTLLLALLIFVVAPLEAMGYRLFQEFGFFIVLAMIGSTLVLSGSAAVAAIMAIALGLNVVVIVLRLRGTPSNLDLYLIACAWLLISLTLGLVVARQVFGPGRVTYHRVIGAVLLYILIAVAFVAFYVIVGITEPNAFAGMKFEDNAGLANELFYFSFVTLTSTGYGDFVPVHPIARSLCNVQSIIGQLYPATLLARLVTLELEGRR